MLKRNIYVLLLVLFVVTSLQSAKVSMTTYSDFNMQLKPDDADKWAMANDPQGQMELKFDINLGKEFSIWMKANVSSANLKLTEADSGFGVVDLHAKYLKTLAGDRGFEISAFADDDSHFYLNQPLLDFSGNSGAWLANSTKSSGLYYNGWNVLGLDFSRIFIIHSGTTNNFGIGFRGRKDFLKGGLKLGYTGVMHSYESANTNYTYYEEGLDFALSLLGPFSITYEIGTCHFSQEIRPDEPQFMFKGELRGSFSLFSGNLGQTGFLFSYYRVDEEYGNWKGNHIDGYDKNREIGKVEWYYNFPLKAIFFKEAFTYSHALDDGSTYGEFTVIGDSYFEHYLEMYIEFINGFKFKTYYKYIEGADSTRGTRGKWKNLLFQLEVENEFAKIKPMVKLLNVGNEDAFAIAYGAEVLINLSDNIKFYSRFAMVAGSKDPDYFKSLEGKKNWATFFAEIQFLKVFSNTDVYFTFGNGDDTNDDLVNDKSGILSGNSTEKRFNINLKFWL